MSATLVESTVDDFSRRVTWHAKLPLGTEIRFFDTRKRRWKRFDWCFQRHPVLASNLHVPHDGETVRSYLSCVERLIAANLDMCGIVIEMVAPSGKLVNALASIGSVRAEPPSREATAADYDSVEQFSEMLREGGWADSLSVHEVGVLYRKLATMHPDLQTRLETRAPLSGENMEVLNAFLHGLPAGAGPAQSRTSPNVKTRQ